MKILIRSLVLVALTAWVGAEFFFPVLATVTFHTLTPDTHTAGIIVGTCLRTLHYIGLGTGLLALVLFAVSPNFRVWSAERTTTPMLVLIVMLALTVLSQWGVTPRMEIDRINAGGAINLLAPDAPVRVHFEMLHKVSEGIEGSVLFCGILTLVLIARMESEETHEE